MIPPNAGKRARPHAACSRIGPGRRGHDRHLSEKREGKAMDLGLGNKVVMITGASRGLGRAMAEALGAEGARLCLCARGAEVLEKAAAELRATGYEVDAEAVDVADPVAAERWVNGVAKRMGGIDVLVNNAGGARMGALKDLDEAAWQAAF